MVKSDLVNYLYFLNEILNEIEKYNEDKTKNKVKETGNKVKETENKVKETEEHTKPEKQTKKLIDDFMLENAFYVSNKYNYLFNESIKKALYDFCMWVYYKK